MRQELLIRRIERLLDSNDYVSCDYHGCFDIATKKNTLVLVKILENVDSFSEEQAKNLKIISNNLDASPILIGLRTRRERLSPGIVYERFEMPTVSLETFESLVRDEIYPKVYRDKGGLYVQIDSKLLKETRDRKGLTQRELAEAVGINKKVIYEHEKKQLRMMLSIAQRLEKILEKKLTQPIGILKKFEEHGYPADVLENRIGSDLNKLGFNTDFVKQAPFDVFAKEKVLIISDIEINRRKMVKRAADLKDFIGLTRKPALLITEKTKEDDLLGIPVLQRKDLEEFENKEELIKLAKRAKYEAV